MRIAIGSTRKPKVDAVKSAMARIVERLSLPSRHIAFLPREVESGIASTPMSLAEMMAGAYNRAENLKLQLTEEGETADYYFGMEGGLFRTKFDDGAEDFYLQSWVYATNGGEGFFGSSPAIQIPRKVTGEFQGRDFELADIMDRLGKVTNNRDKGGAFALLTKGLLTRQAIFEAAVLAAMAPFYNPEIYSFPDE
jgi:inosine/xanthosine triphosphatase